MKTFSGEDTRPDEGAWFEQNPIGPYPAGDVGGDLQVGKAFSRKWRREHPKGGPRQLCIELVVYACRERGRKWIAVEMNHEVWSEPFDNGGEILYEHVEASDGIYDGPEEEEWPTDEHVRQECARVRGCPNPLWRGERF